MGKIARARGTFVLSKFGPIGSTLAGVSIFFALLSLLTPLARAEDGLVKDLTNGCAVFKPNLKSGDSVSWQGGCRNGEASGPGVARWTAGDKSSLTFEGSFAGGKLQGQGRMVASGGDQYVGSYKDGKRDGHGVYVAANRDRFEGDYKDNQRHGRGALRFASGAKVEGEWLNGVQTAKTGSPVVVGAAPATPPIPPAARAALAVTPTVTSAAPTATSAVVAPETRPATPLMSPAQPAQTSPPNSRELLRHQQERQQAEHRELLQAQQAERQQQQQQQQSERKRVQVERDAQFAAQVQQKRDLQVAQQAQQKKAQEEQAAEQLRVRREHEAERQRLAEQQLMGERIAWAIILTFPLIIGGWVGGLKSKRGVLVSDWINGWVSSRFKHAREKTSRFALFVERPTMWSSQKLFALTASITDQYVKAGIRLTLFTFLLVTVATILFVIAYMALLIFLTIAAVIIGFWVLDLVVNDGRASQTKVASSRSYSLAQGRSSHHEGLFDSYTKTETPDGVYKTRQVEGFLDSRLETTDGRGNVVAQEREREGFFGDKYTEITDSSGKVIGEKREIKSWHDPRTVTTDSSGNVISESRDREGLFGAAYTEHKRV